MAEWLYEKVNRVPAISDHDIMEMRHIEPVLRVGQGCMFRRMKDADQFHPRNVSFLWDAEPIGQEFTFHTLDVTEIVTQHHSSVFFKPSLAEVYAWIRVYMPETWQCVQFFCMGEHRRIGSSSDVMCTCHVMGGEMLVKGREFLTAGGSISHELVRCVSS